MLKENIIFMREFLAEFQATGSCFPTSKRAAQELSLPLAGPRAPKNILELGPGTGAVTLQILDRMIPGDRLSICEINPRFMEELKSRLNQLDSFRKHRENVSFFLGPIQEFPEGGDKFDVIVCSLPFLNFEVEVVEDIFGKLQRLSTDQTVMSYYQYMGMRSIGIPQSFAFSRHSEPEPQPLPAYIAPALSASLPVRRVPAPPVRSRPFATVARPVSPRAEPPGAGDAAVLLAHIATLANEGKSPEARAACEAYLRSHGPVAQVFYWLGLLSDVAGSVLEAQGFYRKALYLEPQHPEALMHLAALLASQGDVAGSRRLQERAARNERTADSERKR